MRRAFKENVVNYRPATRYKTAPRMYCAAGDVGA